MSVVVASKNMVSPFVVSSKHPQIPDFQCFYSSTSKQIYSKRSNYIACKYARALHVVVDMHDVLFT